LFCGGGCRCTHNAVAAFWLDAAAAAAAAAAAVFTARSATIERSLLVIQEQKPKVACTALWREKGAYFLAKLVGQGDLFVSGKQMFARDW
jgi:hypothetical protein